MAASLKQTQMVEPLLQPRLPIATRISYFLRMWGLKAVTTLAFSVIRLMWPAKLHPTMLRAYPCRPRLQTRIFIPNSYKTGDVLPLYLDVHGGGFCLGDAQFDDHFCHTFANRLNILVVSIEHGKAPLNKFPGPSNDVAAIAQAVVEDESLPVDQARVVLGGFSAGGNLSLSVAQMPALKGMIKGVVSWYPITDFTLKPAEKQASRSYRSAKDVDDLKDWGPIWNWAYVLPGQDLRDPRLSVRYARRDSLPSWIYVIGAEYDMLANEARQMLFDIAGLDRLERDEGAHEVEKGTFRWTLAKDVRHGFTHDLMNGTSQEEESARLGRTKEMIEKVGEWLFKGPFR